MTTEGDTDGNNKPPAVSERAVMTPDLISTEPATQGTNSTPPSELNDGGPGPADVSVEKAPFFHADSKMRLVILPTLSDIGIHPYRQKHYQGEIPWNASGAYPMSALEQENGGVGWRWPSIGENRANEAIQNGGFLPVRDHVEMNNQTDQAVLLKDRMDGLPADESQKTGRDKMGLGAFFIGKGLTEEGIRYNKRLRQTHARRSHPYDHPSFCRAFGGLPCYVKKTYFVDRYNDAQ